MTKQVLILSTRGGDLRSCVDGWTCEDATLYVPGKPIGFTPSPRCEGYDTALEALADGWDLLGPPRLEENGLWEWWMIRRQPVVG